MANLDALIAQIEAGDSSAYDVLADALVDRGDPRGELIHVQRALVTATADDQQRLRDRELMLVAESSARLFGSRDAHGMRVHYANGFLDWVAIQSPQLAASAEVLRHVLASQDARFLRELVLDPTEECEAGPIAGLLEQLRGVAMPRSLRRLELGSAYATSPGFRIYSDYGQIAFADDLAAVLDVFPLLEELHVDLGAVSLEWAPLRSTQLRRFTWIAPMLADDALASIAQSQLPALEHVELWPGAAYLVNEEADLYQGDELEIEQALDDEGLAPLFAMLETTPVSSLVIRNYAHDAEQLRHAIEERPLGRQLRELVVDAHDPRGPDELELFRYVITQE